MNEIALFAATKAIYVVQFIRSDSEIEFGSMAQRQACSFCQIDVGIQQHIWEEGGMDSFCRQLTEKRKSMTNTIRKAIVTSE